MKTIKELNEGASLKVTLNNVKFVVSFSVERSNVSYQFIPMTSKDLDKFAEEKDLSIKRVEDALKKWTGIDFKYDSSSNKAGADFIASNLALSDHMIKMIK